MRLVKPSATFTALTLWVASSLCGVTALGASALEEKPGATTQTAPAKTPAKAPAKTPAKQPQKAPGKAEAPTSSFRRDPFQPLISKAEPGKTNIPENLPPGPGGLMVSTMKLEGIVRAGSGMIAVVSNPQGRVYFIREGQQLYDGTVEKISMDSMTLREKGKDPFGKVIERQVVKRLYPRAGEQ
jgi:Tfp pilus assembly protein PilP